VHQSVPFEEDAKQNTFESSDLNFARKQSVNVYSLQRGSLAYLGLDTA